MQKCSGTNCKLKERCSLYDPFSSIHDTIHAPFQIKNGVFSCWLFKEQALLRELTQGILKFINQKQRK